MFKSATYTSLVLCGTLSLSGSARAADSVELGSIENPLGIGCFLADPIGLRVGYGIYGHEGSEPVAVLFNDVVTAPTSATTVLTVGATDDPDFEAVALGLEQGVNGPLGLGLQVEMVPPEVSLPIDQPGAYRVTLTVHDRFVSSPTQSVVITAPTAAELLEELVQLITESPKNDFAKGKRNVILVQLADIANLRSKANDADIANASELLRHVNGCAEGGAAVSPQDWIVNCETQFEFRALLLGLIATMESEG
jgi:hypothetical protein